MSIDHVPYNWRPTSAELNEWIDDINSALGTVVGGALNMPYTTVAANTNLNATHGFVAVDASGGARTITLPSAVGITGRIYTIKKTDTANTNAVTIDTTAGQTVDGYASGAGALKLYAAQSAITVISTGSGWRIVNRQKSIRLQWTPVLDAVTTPPTLGTGGIATGYWYEDGEAIEGSFYFTFGTGLSAGVGDYRIAMPTPVAPNSTYGPMGHGLFYDASTGSSTTLYLEQDTGLARVQMLRNGTGKVGPAIPVAPASGDNCRGWFRYYKA